VADYKASCSWYEAFGNYMSWQVCLFCVTIQSIVKMVKGCTNNCSWSEKNYILKIWEHHCWTSTSFLWADIGDGLDLEILSLLAVINCYATEEQELISRWDSEREHFYDDIIHLEARAYAHWTDFLSVLIYAAANQGHSSTSFIILCCEPASAVGWSWFSAVLAANHLCTYTHQTELSEFVLPK